MSLLETSSQQKREKFLEIIRQESPSWADALETRLLSMDRIFNWSDDVVAEIFKGLPVRNMACAFKGISPENAERVRNFMGHGEKRKLDDELAGLSVKPEEINTTFVKVIEIARKMIVDGYIRLEKVDPALEISEDIEEKLEQGAGPSVKVASGAQQASSEDKKVEQTQEAILKSQNSGSVTSPEVLQMQRLLQTLSKENKSLKEENKTLKERLEQIRKIA